MKRRSFLRQLGLAASAAWFGRSALAASDEPRTASSTTHKILNCNARVDLAEDRAAGDGWADRKEQCADVIHAQKADLIGLQEAQAMHLAHLKTRMPEYDSFALSYPTARFHPANAILYLRSRYELISAGGFWLSESPHVAGSKSWDSAKERFVNWVHLKECSSGKELRFWNTHLDHRGHEARAKGAALIVEASAPFAEDFPQFLTGDMNAGLKHPAIKNFKAGGWVDTYAALHGPEDPGFTFHGFKGPKAAPTNDAGETRSKIDWVFSRGVVKPVSAEIIRDGRNGRYPSDHYFVSAVVEF